MEHDTYDIIIEVPHPPDSTMFGEKVNLVGGWYGLEQTAVRDAKVIMLHMSPMCKVYVVRRGIEEQPVVWSSANEEKKPT